MGLVPSGTSDPFGLRRHTIAVLRILLDRGWRLSLWDLAEYALRLLEDRLKRKRDEALSDIEDFFRGRLYNMLVPDKFSHDIAAAVIERFGQDPVDAVKRMEALASMKNEEDFERLAIGFKRVIMPEANLRSIDSTDGVEVVPVRNIFQALSAVLSGNH